MNRRLYFLLPDKAHALSLCNELAQTGIETEHIHALANAKVPLGDLPHASWRQSHDTARHVEKILWNANLIIFSIAFGSLVTLLVSGLMSGAMSGWLLLPAGIMLATFLVGLRFTHVPNTHLDEFRDALEHGEILLMVDVPVARVADIEHRVHRHHPEAAVGGVGWETSAFGL